MKDFDKKNIEFIQNKLLDLLAKEFINIFLILLTVKINQSETQNIRSNIIYITFLF